MSSQQDNHGVARAPVSVPGGTGPERGSSPSTTRPGPYKRQTSVPRGDLRVPSSISNSCVPSPAPAVAASSIPPGFGTAPFAGTTVSQSAAPPLQAQEYEMVSNHVPPIMYMLPHETNTPPSLVCFAPSNLSSQQTENGSAQAAASVPLPRTQREDSEEDAHHVFREALWEVQGYLARPGLVLPMRLAAGVEVITCIRNFLASLPEAEGREMQDNAHSISDGLTDATTSALITTLNTWLEKPWALAPGRPVSELPRPWQISARAMQTLRRQAEERTTIDAIRSEVTGFISQQLAATAAIDNRIRVLTTRIEDVVRSPGGISGQSFAAAVSSGSNQQRTPPVHSATADPRRPRAPVPSTNTAGMFPMDTTAHSDDHPPPVPASDSKGKGKAAVDPRRARPETNPNILFQAALGESATMAAGTKRSAPEDTQLSQDASTPPPNQLAKRPRRRGTVQPRADTPAPASTGQSSIFDGRVVLPADPVARNHELQSIALASKMALENPQVKFGSAMALLRSLHTRPTRLDPTSWQRISACPHSRSYFCPGHQAKTAGTACHAA